MVWRFFFAVRNAEHLLKTISEVSSFQGKETSCICTLTVCSISCFLLVTSNSMVDFVLVLHGTNWSKVKYVMALVISL